MLGLVLAAAAALLPQPPARQSRVGDVRMAVASLQQKLPTPQLPRNARESWSLHKFGGASLATADLYRTVGDLLIREAAGREDDAASSGSIPTMAIVSARGGMTDLLVKVVDSALLDYEQAEKAANEAVESQISLLKQLAPPEITDPIEARFRSDGQDILSVVSSLRMLRTVPAVTMEVVTGT